ncbi:MAG TPA: sphingomyelin phosphodiesterase [Paludibacter sp.]|nr:sphingomyelin phosphodiesterase [Paludibacter sp.]
MCKKLFLFYILLSMVTPPIFSQVPNVGAAKSATLKILSWNIYMLPYISLFNQNDERAKTIAARLNESDYQIVVFQEAFSLKCRRLLSKRLAASFPYQYGPANKNHLPLRTNSGLWVVSKIPLRMLGQMRFSTCTGYDRVARKGAVLFEGNFNDVKFQLLTTHLQANNLKIVKKQCSEIREHLLNPYCRNDVPQLICGDFNIDRNDEQAYQQMLKTLDAKNGEISGNLKVTFDKENNNLASKAKGKSQLIDYVLVRNDELVHNIDRRIHAFLAKIGKRESNLSDHYAMEFDVDFTNPHNLDPLQEPSDR